MQLSDPIQPVLASSVVALRDAAGHFLRGADTLAAFDVSGPQWRASFDAAIRAINPAWAPGMQGVRDVRAALAELGDDARAVTARGHVASAVRTMYAGLNYASGVLMHLPARLTPEAASLAVRRIANASRVIGDAITRAAEGVSTLVATDRPLSMR